MRAEERAKIAAAFGQVPAAGSTCVPPRPEDAVGTFLRMVTINDIYILANYPKVASALAACRTAAAPLDCVVTSHLNGDFLSPCIYSSLDSGKAMMDGAQPDEYRVCLLGQS